MLGKEYTITAASCKCLTRGRGCISMLYLMRSSCASSRVMLNSCCGPPQLARVQLHLLDLGNDENENETKSFPLKYSVSEYENTEITSRIKKFLSIGKSRLPRARMLSLACESNAAFCNNTRANSGGIEVLKTRIK